MHDDPGTRPERPIVSATIDPSVTLGLLIAALEIQRRTSLALCRLMRGAARNPRPTSRGRPCGERARERHVRRVRADVVDSAVAPPLLSDTGLADLPTARLATSALQVRCFGRFEVLRGGVPIDHWRRGKAKALLKHLVVRRQPVPRDVLIDLLWPDSDPQVAVNGLRVALHALRQALGTCDVAGQGRHDFVVFEGGSYGVNPAVDVWVDADEFGKHFVAGMRAERQGRLQLAVAHYERAEAMYRDDYLIEDLYEDWTLVRREELKDQYLMVLTKLADVCLIEGDAEGCIIRCHKILQKDACREDAYRRLMRCYGQLGQRSQALHWYDLCARTLRQELDVDPSEQTVDLYQDVCAGKTLFVAPGSLRRGRVGFRLGEAGAISGGWTG